MAPRLPAPGWLDVVTATSRRRARPAIVPADARVGRPVDDPRVLIGTRRCRHVTSLASAFVMLAGPRKWPSRYRPLVSSYPDPTIQSVLGTDTNTHLQDTFEAWSSPSATQREPIHTHSVANDAISQAPSRPARNFPAPIPYDAPWLSHTQETDDRLRFDAKPTFEPPAR